ncbi:MAG: carbohydrate porin [Burkholderiaceae bacterium]|nr:carbohydrate porin [Burkholderiaceae bacterium]
MRMFALGLPSLAATAPALAQPVEVPPTWGGDFWSRTRATGSWGGVRDELGKKGVVFDADLLLTPQDVVSGGRSTGAEFWGNADLTLNIDTGKLGLWPGGFFKLSSDSGFGTNAYSNSGAIVPVNSAALIPAPNDRTTALMNATFMQFLSTKFGLFLGKINTLDLAKQEFYGDYSTQFQNTAFLTPMTLQQVPLSAFGGGVIGLPTEDIILSVVALDPSGTPTSNDLGNAFKDGAMAVGSGQVTIKPFGLVGHQSLGFSWSDKERLSLNQDRTNIARFLLTEKFPRLGNPGPILERILARFFPGLLVPVQPANRTSRTWSANYSFDQYFWQPEGDSKHGMGAFFEFGASDGNPNPIKYAFIVGIGGKGMLPSRGDDSFGIAFAHTKFSSEFLPFLRQRLDLGLEHENAVEMYYNASITKSLSATGDLQIVDSALNKTLVESSVRPSLTNVSTAVVLGLRLRARF